MNFRIFERNSYYCIYWGYLKCMDPRMNEILTKKYHCKIDGRYFNFTTKEEAEDAAEYLDSILLLYKLSK